MRQWQIGWNMKRTLDKLCPYVPESLAWGTRGAPLSCAGRGAGATRPNRDDGRSPSVFFRRGHQGCEVRGDATRRVSARWARLLRMRPVASGHRRPSPVGSGRAGSRWGQRRNATSMDVANATSMTATCATDLQADDCQESHRMVGPATDASRRVTVQNSNGHYRPRPSGHAPVLPGVSRPLLLLSSLGRNIVSHNKHTAIVAQTSTPPRNVSPNTLSAVCLRGRADGAASMDAWPLRAASPTIGAEIQSNLHRPSKRAPLTSHCTLRPAEARTYASSLHSERCHTSATRRRSPGSKA